MGSSSHDKQVLENVRTEDIISRLMTGFIYAGITCEIRGR